MYMASSKINSTGIKKITESDVTQLHTFSGFECKINKARNICTGFVTLTNGSGETLVGGTTDLVSGLPIPYEGVAHQLTGAYVSGADAGKVIRARVRYDGVFQLWYGGSVPDGVSVTFSFAYMTNP